MEQGLIRLSLSLSAPQTPVNTINAPQAWASRVATKRIEEASMALGGVAVILLGQLFDWADKPELWVCVVWVAGIGPRTGVMGSQLGPVAKIPPQQL